MPWPEWLAVVLRQRVTRSAGGKFQFVLSGYLQEDHGSPIFGVTICPFITDGTFFATVGGARASVYRLSEEGGIQAKQSFCDPNLEEIYYTCAWSMCPVTNHVLLAVGGLRGVIRILDTTDIRCVKHYLGHGGAINELVFFPNDRNILASASKDHTVRLWNISTDTLVGILGGIDGHRDEVLGVDVHLNGEWVASCGIDHSVKLWHLGGLAEVLRKSYTGEKADTVWLHYPVFSTREVHKNYVDCVHFHGNHVLSKSCENSIIWWKPGAMDSGLDPSSTDDGNLSFLHQFPYPKSNIWYVRFAINPTHTALAVGNQVGKVFVWSLSEPEVSATVLIHNKCKAVVRQVSMNERFLLAACDDSTVWCWRKTS